VRGFAPERSPAAAVGQWQVSVNGGDKPRWSADGKELFYIAADGKMMAVPFKSGALFEPGVPVPLFDTPPTAGFKPYDVAPDGRFLINTLSTHVGRFSLRIIVNWFAGIDN
jgi:hypothetical protein